MATATSERQETGAHPLFSLKGKVALVTGSSRGLGHAMAVAFARQGAHVIVHGRDPDQLAALAERLEESGANAGTASFDVTDMPACERAIDAIVSDHGRLDILVNNAGLASRSSIAETALADWRTMLDANLTSCFLLAQRAGAHMREREYGRIINISSAAGLFAARDRAAYVTTKHALMGLTKSLALEFAPFGITANAIAPGFIATDMTAAIRENSQADSWVKARNPQGRWGEPDDVAFAAAYLASEEAKFVNGAILTVDGGMSAVVI
ncbi:MAG: SDR family NAD(P)-dependent oxidoreductase [Parasphingopyxis sp.]|uniref:SDR family NAD(P)-dependent oxidoreductase n=1 Tax=Parasphingopyxis sp. TaxID=1920299 RepID=UPI003F9F6E22